MAAKLVFDPNLDEKIMKRVKLPRVLYTGTTEEYFCKKLLMEGEFTHGEGYEIFLNDEHGNPIAVAFLRAKFYRDKPLLLIVDTKRLKGEIKYSGCYTTKSLNIGCFKTYPIFCNEEGRVSMESYKSVYLYRKWLIESPRKDIEQNINEYMRKYKSKR